MIRIILIIFLLLTTGLGISAWMAVEDSPRVVASSASQLNNADEVDALYKQLQQSVTQRNAGSTISVTETQLLSLQGMIQRAYPRVNGDVSLAKEQGVMRGTVGFKLDSGQRFVNVEVFVKDGEGLPIEKVKVGGVTIPGGIAKFIGAKAINLYTGSKVGGATLDSFERIDMLNGNVKVHLKPLGPLLEELNKINTGDDSPEDLYVEQQTAMYLALIHEYEKKNGVKPRSLNDYMQLVFAKAAQVSTLDNAVANNRAAIFSLAIFAGHYRIGTFVGDVQADPEKPVAPNHWPLLAGREDLTKHFIISAALKLISKPGVSFAAGEFKELMDRADGGSGFSFVDLAADRAGVRFAMRAVLPDTALAFQQALASSNSEETYFPPLNGLTEGYSKRAFTDKFSSVDSVEYRKEVNKIRNRIRKLPIYAG